MTKEEIREKYLKCIEERIQSAEYNENDVNFDRLVKLCESSYGYDLFYPLHRSSFKFDDICNLYSRFHHDIEDDGDSSFVCSEIMYVQDFHGFREPKEVTIINSFVIAGHREELNPQKVYELATLHQSYSSKYSFVGFSAIRFDWEVLEFLYSLLGEFKEIEELGGNSGFFDNKGNILKDALDYYRRGRDMDNKFKNYIESKENCYKWKNKINNEFKSYLDLLKENRYRCTDEN